MGRDCASIANRRGHDENGDFREVNGHFEREVVHEMAIVWDLMTTLSESRYRSEGSTEQNKLSECSNRHAYVSDIV